MVYHFVWRPTIKGQNLDEGQMELEKAFLYNMMTNSGFKIPLSEKSITTFNINNDPISGFGFGNRDMFAKSIRLTQADLYPYILKAQALMKSRLKASKGRTHAHYAFLLKVLEQNIK